MKTNRKRNIYISDVIGQPYQHLLNNTTHTHQVVYGGRASAKSSFHEVKIPYLFLKDSNAEAVVVRKDYRSHRDTTFAGLKTGFERIGWKLKQGRDYPRGATGTLYMQTQQGNYIHFIGMNNYEATKGARPHFSDNSIKILWFMEITEFNSEEEMNQVISNYIRGNKDYFIILYEYNPHFNPSHWTYEWVKKMEKRDDAIVQKTNYNDLPKKQQHDFLGENILREIEALRQYDYEQFKNIYLGLPANITGGIYKKFNRERHLISNYEGDYYDLSIGVDYGETDATAFTLKGYTKGRDEMHIIDTYYHKNGESANEKTIDDYIEDLFEFCEDVWNRFGLYFSVKIDSANKSFASFMKKEKVKRRVGYFKVSTTNKTQKTRRYASAIEERIGIVNLMLGSDFLKIYSHNKELINAIEYADRDKNGNRRDDGSKNIDSIDSMEYSFIDDIAKIETAITRK